MGGTVVLVDGDGNYYGLDASLLECRRRSGPKGEYFDVSTDELAAARIDGAGRAALQTAFIYERAGDFSDSGAGDVVRLAGDGDDRVLRVIGHIG